MLYPVLQDPLRPIVSSLFDRPRGASIGQMLFGAGEQGGWYDVSDMSTLFQDEAGTTPVTAVEQPVGRILDKSGRGNHATQATATKRPVYSRLVNLLLKTEDFADAVWTSSALDATVASNTDEAPDGTLTADTVTFPTGAAYLYFGIINYPAVTGNSVVLTSHSRVPQRIFRFGGATPVGTDVHSVEDIGGGWYRHKTVRTFTETVSTKPIQALAVSSIVGTGSFVIWGASVTTAIDAHLPYQRVNTATDYDADPAKFPAYLRFDGVDDALQTANIDFTSTDKMTVWAGVTKLSDAAAGIVAEFGVFSNTTLYGSASVQTVAAGGYLYGSRGTLGATASAATGYVAPTSNVISGIGGISGDTATLRVNSTQAAQSTADQGTGNYGNYLLYIGARVGTSLYFNGRLYSLILRGAQTPLSQIEATELYIKQKMRLP